MRADDAWARLRDALRDAPSGVRLDRDELGDAVVFVRRDLTHLDADALNDRLHAWSARDVAPRVPGASAFVGFRHARPASEDEAELDTEAAWLDLEPTFRLDLHAPPPTAAHVDAFAALVPAFLARVEADGRPDGWRRVDEGHAE